MIPISLYIHTPWCIRKCPYCDFNSHALRGNLPEEAYVSCLLKDWEYQLPLLQGRQLSSIFIGGGTPSLLSAESYTRLFEGIQVSGTMPSNIEITLEANPGTFEQERFNGFRKAGINRLSIGIQSFQAKHLTLLGRVHNHLEARKAIDIAKAADFTNINLDLMHGLPEQTIEQALDDLQIAIDCNVPHISWYQLTLEPNTLFHKFPPTLPPPDVLWQIQQEGQTLLSSRKYENYEISAYTKDKKYSQHNLNYWSYGDYVGIGAGAHGKITELNSKKIHRYVNHKHPELYMAQKNSFHVEQTIVDKKEQILEFFMNTFRLKNATPLSLLYERTTLEWSDVASRLNEAKNKGFLEIKNEEIHLTSHGYRYLNDLLEIFL